MAGEKALVWDRDSERLYETGIKNVALFVVKDDGTYNNGVAWNGVTGVTESPSGAEATDLWADDRKYATLRSAEQLGGTITAYMYPKEWEICDGSAEPTDGLHFGQQARRKFALAYITTQGNDTELNDYGERLHLLYGATASPSERAYATINDSPEAIEFSWEFETTPIDVAITSGSGQSEVTTKYKPLSLITIDKKPKGMSSGDLTTYLTKYQALCEFVFGKDGTRNPTMPTPQQVYDLITTGDAGE